LIEAADALVIDANLSENLIADLFAKYKDKPIYVDGVSQTKVLKFKPYLDRITMLKVNLSEFASLFGEELPLNKTRIVDILSQSATKYIITNGKLPVTFNDSHTLKEIPVETPSRFLTSTGAGDALFAGVIFGNENRLFLSEAIKLGIKLARLTFENGLTKLGQLDLTTLIE
jgi:pseudouridine kinase